MLSSGGIHPLHKSMITILKNMVLATKIWWDNRKNRLFHRIFGAEDQKVVSNPLSFAESKGELHFPCVNTENMDYLQIKKILLAEYLSNGGTDTREFLRGMNYLEDYLESGRKDHALNSHVDELMFLRSRVTQLEAEVDELDRTLRNKNNIIKQYRQMTKEEKYRWKVESERIRLETVYSRMVMELEEKYKRKRFLHKPEKPEPDMQQSPRGRKVYKAAPVNP